MPTVTESATNATRNRQRERAEELARVAWEAIFAPIVDENDLPELFRAVVAALQLALDVAEPARTEAGELAATLDDSQRMMDRAAAEIGNRDSERHSADPGELSAIAEELVTMAANVRQALRKGGAP